MANNFVKLVFGVLDPLKHVIVDRSNEKCSLHLISRAMKFIWLV